MKENLDPNINDIENFTDLTKASVKRIRQVFVNTDFLIPTAQSLILEKGVELSQLKNVYVLPFIVTKEIKLSMFQYKIIHNILPLKSYLFKVGLSKDDTCPFCDCERHTTSHFFVDCEIAKVFWNQFRTWWTKISAKSEFTATPASILYGLTSDIKNNLLLNHLILIAKQYMYNAFVKEQLRYTFQSFLNFATQKYDFEIKIASAKPKREQQCCNLKWSPFSNFLSKNNTVL
ncbi:MAG: hypothetical protein DSY43_00300 [Gammaproteobacteria bacterium]|nr:MAG: hypothetical protein DSY43_00300 [Gammaproteobacteria bacterium]